MRLAIISTHPIQYNAPLFQLLTSRGKIDLKVFYTWSQSEKGNIFDPGFGIEKKWDIPLLEGYDFEFINNIANQPGSGHFWGIQNPEIIKKIRSYNPEAIFIYGWSFASHLKVLRYFKGKIPIYFRGDSTLLDESSSFGLKKFLRKIALTWVYKHIDFALYVGENNKEYFIKYGLKEKQLVFAPHSIDIKRFSNSKDGQLESLKKLKEKVGIPEETIVILFAGKFESKKDPFLLLYAFEQIQKEGIHLLFVGNGELEKELKKQSSNNKNVHFLPFQNQNTMPDIYKMADIFVLPSKGPAETWGLAVNEAMACGLAVIVSDKCGCSRDLVIDGSNGFVFKSRDIHDLKKKLTTTLDNNTCKEMGTVSLQIIQEYSFNRAASAIENSLLTN